MPLEAPLVMNVSKMDISGYICIDSGGVIILNLVFQSQTWVTVMWRGWKPEEPWGAMESTSVRQAHPCSVNLNHKACKGLGRNPRTALMQVKWEDSFSCLEPQPSSVLGSYVQLQFYDQIQTGTFLMVANVLLSSLINELQLWKSVFQD